MEEIPMIRAMLAVCAGAGLALFQAGCANTNFAGLFFGQSDIPNGDGVVVGKLDVVAASTQAKLQQLGFKVAMTQEGDAIHLTSATKGGATFKLVLTREMTRQGEQTRIKLQWGNGYDRAAAVQILAEVTPKTSR
jgi:hypothetical protein